MKSKRIMRIFLVIMFLLTYVLPVNTIADSYWIPMDKPLPREAFWGQNATYVNVCNAIVDALNSAAEDSAAQGSQPWTYNGIDLDWCIGAQTACH